MKPTIRHSHNDYWCKRPLTDGIEHGCTMIEADIIFIGNKLMLSHSWRPFSCMCYGEIEQTYFKPLYQYCLNNPDKTMWFYVEFKDSHEKIIPLLYHFMRSYRLHNLHFTISAQNKYWFHKSRYRTCMEFYKQYKDELSLTWKTTELEDQYNIQSIDLYPSSLWHF